MSLSHIEEKVPISHRRKVIIIIKSIMEYLQTDGVIIPRVANAVNSFLAPWKYDGGLRTTMHRGKILQ